MEVKKLVVGQLATNCYLVWDEKTKEAIIIDPGDDGDYILKKILDLKLQPKYIVATHGHFDHVSVTNELKLAFNIPFVINKKDVFLLSQAQKSAKHFLGVLLDPPAKPDRFIKDKDKIKFGKEKLIVLETPGHTPGSVCLYYIHPRGENLLFTGDTLFANGIGRTDFSYSSDKNLKKAVNKLLKLPKYTIIYSGHGEQTTIANILRFKQIY